MQGLIAIWQGLTTARKATVVIALLATMAAFYALAQTASKPNMSLLYAGLDSRSSGEVIAALERMDIQFSVRGDAIYVPSSRRDIARMTLAGDGLPQSGQAGYELLDELNGFSTTSEMFDATFWRAKEGEIARTIVSTPGVSAARVHIGKEKGGPFSRRAGAPSAVVTVTMGRGQLSQSQAKAIQFLVGSAVAGLSPDDVAVLDALRGVVLSPGQETMKAVEGDTLGDREQKIEDDILNLLEARVGVGNARVQVALDIDRERETISERVFDPEGRVVSGREVNEVTERASGSGGAPVTVASNLPEGDVEGGNQESNSSRTETREITRYDMSEIRREREKLPGAIRRQSIAVLINDTIEGDEGLGDTRRTAEEVETLRLLVAQAAGFDEARGDTITIQALPFKPLADDGTLVQSNPIGAFFAQNLMAVIQLFVLSAVTLILGLFVVKPVLANQPAPALEGPGGDDFSMDIGLEPLPALPEFDDVQEPEDNTPLDSLKGAAMNKTEATANLLRDWLEEEEAKA
ncbi:MAG: flagellar basal-body MS-ring/collar protein FliF [Pseudomonadota bacterium]